MRSGLSSSKSSLLQHHPDVECKPTAVSGTTCSSSSVGITELVGKILQSV